MRIVTKSQLLKCPPGTIISRIDPVSFEEFMVFRGPCGDDDFFLTYIDRPALAQRTVEGWETMLAGKSAPVNLDSEERDASFLDDDLFAVWERDDVESLVAILRESLKKAY